MVVVEQLTIPNLSSFFPGRQELAVPGGTVMPGGVFVPSNCPPVGGRSQLGPYLPLGGLPRATRQRSPSPRRVEPLPSIDHETLGLLLRQLYGLPVEIPSTLMSNDLELPVVSFEEAQRVISSGQIVNYHLDPFLQPWAGPPSGENRDGSSSLVRARYDPTARLNFSRSVDRKNKTPRKDDSLVLDRDCRGDISRLSAPLPTVHDRS